MQLASKINLCAIQRVGALEDLLGRHCGLDSGAIERPVVAHLAAIVLVWKSGKRTSLVPQTTISGTMLDS